LTDQSGSSGHQPTDEEENVEGAHDKHEYEIFHVEFDRVEVPFIIALWIFVSSLAKIGKLKLWENNSIFAITS